MNSFGPYCFWIKGNKNKPKIRVKLVLIVKNFWKFELVAFGFLDPVSKIFNFSSLFLIRNRLKIIDKKWYFDTKKKGHMEKLQFKPNYLFNIYLEEILADQLYEWSRPGSIVIRFLTRRMPYYCRCQPPSSDWPAARPRPRRCRWHRGWATACWPQRCRWSCCCCPRDRCR